MVLPASSGQTGGGAVPAAHWLCQSPLRSAASRRKNSRVNASIAPITYSAMPFSWPCTFASHAPLGTADGSIWSRPAPGTWTSLRRVLARPISSVSAIVTNTSTSASIRIISTWSDTTISQGIVRFRRMAPSKLAANVPTIPTVSIGDPLRQASLILKAKREAAQFPHRELEAERRAGIVGAMRSNQPRAVEGATSHVSAFGQLLKDWRGRRGFSQLDLATAARTTQRHLSFVETGRAKPSREMILRLAATMSLSLRQQNALMLAAGYASVWRERDLSAPDLAVVNSALDYMLAQHEPYPAFVIDRCWNLLRANRGALNLTEFLTGAAPATTASEPLNLAVALLAPDSLRTFVINWQEVALHFIRGVQADAHAGGIAATAELLERLLAFPDVPSVAELITSEESQSPVLPIHFQRNGTSLRLFTTIATLGTPRDVTLEEIRIEFFFSNGRANRAGLQGLDEMTRYFADTA